MMNLFQTKDNFLKKKVWSTLLVAVIYLFGLNVPLPFIETAKSTISRTEDLLFFANAGGNSGTSLFVLGLAPWMISMIVWRVATEFFRDNFAKIPQKKQYRYQMMMVLCLAFIFSLFKVNSLEIKEQLIKEAMISIELVQLSLIVIMIAGTFLLIWFGNLISEHGIGGVTAIIIVNMILNLTRQLTEMFENHDWKVELIVGLLVFSILLTVVLLATEQAEYRLNIQQTVLYNSLADKLYIPFKLNSAGAMAVMYGLTLFSFFTIVTQLLVEFNLIKGISDELLSKLSLDHELGLVIYAIILALLSYLFTSLNVSSSLLSKNMQRQGDYIDGVRLGSATKKYLKKRIRVIALIGMFLTLLIGVLPFYLSLYYPSLKEFAQLPSSLMVLIIIMLNLLTQVKHLNQRSVYSTVSIIEERRVK